MNTEPTETTESIVDALTEAFAENMVDTDPESVEAEAPQQDSEAVEVADVDDGEATPTEENEVVAEAEEDSEAEEPERVFQAPEHWSSETKEQFAALDPEAQEILLTRDKEFQKGYQERVQGITDIQQALEPWKQTIAQLGISEGQAIRSLFATYNKLLSNPLTGIQELAQNFGVLDQLTAPDTDDDFVDPEIKALRNQVQELGGQLKDFSNQQQQATVTQGQQMLNEFKSAVDASGKPAHPFFEEAMGTIIPLIQEGKTLDEAYNEAKWTVPAYREAALKKGPTDIEKARKVKQAKKAASSIDNKGGDAPEKSDKDVSLTDEIKAVWNESQS